MKKQQEAGIYAALGVSTFMVAIAALYKDGQTQQGLSPLSVLVMSVVLMAMTGVTIMLADEAEEEEPRIGPR